MEWISVKDRLPELGNDYLVTDGFACMVSVFRGNEWDFWNIKWWSSEQVTHWMPLPNHHQMNNHYRINRIRIAILDEMRKINRKAFSIANVKRFDLLQRRYEKCNILLYGMAQPFNH